MDIEIWLAFVAASFVILMIPGPTILLVMSYALTHGRQIALVTAAGVAVGDFLAMTVSLAGLGALLMASADLFFILKWLGAAYLIYLGIKLLRTSRTSPKPQSDDMGLEKKAAGHIFTHAAAVTALNPKSIAFFIAFVPQFMSSEAALFPQLSVMVLTFVGLAIANVLFYALLASYIQSRISSPMVQNWFARIGGSAMILMGIVTATTRRVTG